MAQGGNTVELVVRVNNQASAGINRIASDVQGLGRAVEAGPLGALGRLSTSFGALAGAAGVGLLVQGFKKAITAAAEADQSFRQMASSVELAGGSMAKSGAVIQASIKRLFDTTTFDDEALQDALSGLVTRTGDLTASLRALPIVADLAAKTGSDLSSAVQTIGLAAEGSARGLKQLGISFTEAQNKAFMLMTEAERLNIALGLIAEKSSGAAATNVASWGGELKMAGKDLAEIWEKVGGAIFIATDAMNVYLKRIRDVEMPKFWGYGSGYVEGGGGGFGGKGASGSWGSDVPSGAAARGLLAMATDLAAFNPQAEKARATTQGWQSDAQQLMETMRDLGRNVADVTRRTGDADTAIFAYRDEILKLAADADRLGVTAPAAFRKIVAAAEELRRAGLPQLPQGMTLEQFQRFTTGQTASPVANVTGFNAASKRLIDQAREDWAQTFKEGAQRLADAAEEFGRITTDVFSDLAMTGGQNFGAIAGRAFQQAVQAGAGQFTNLLTAGIASIFGAQGQVTERNGRFFVEGGPAGGFGSFTEAIGATPTGQRVTTAVGAGIGGAAHFVGALSQSGGQRQSALSIIAGQTAAGAGVGSVFGPVGTVIGAIAGAVVGAVGAILAPAQGEDYPYARYGVRGGQAFFDYSSQGGQGQTGRLQNIGTPAARQSLAQLETAFGTAYADFVRIMLRFPVEVLPATFAQIGDILPRVGRDIGGDMGRAASATFWRDFALWFEQGMPREMASRFRPVFAQAFEGMGFTIARFNEIWTSLQDLDPAEARALLDQWAQAATELPEAFAFLRQPFGGRGGGLDWAQREMRRSPADRLTEAYDPILRLANTLGNLPIAEQIRGWAEVNRQIQEVQQNFKDLLLEIAEGIRSITESYGASIRELEIAGIRTPEGEPDYQGQAEYLRRYANDLRARIAVAATPEEALALGEELRGVIMQIYGLGQQMGPEAGEAFRLWALAALEEGRDAVVEQLRDIGRAAAAANQAFLDSIQGPWEEFTGAAAEATRDFTAALIGAIERIKGFPGGGDGGDRNLPEIPIVQPSPKDGGGGAYIAERMERAFDTAFAKHLSRATQILAAAAHGTTQAVLSKELSVTVVTEEAPVYRAPSPGPSSRRGRMV